MTNEERVKLWDAVNEYVIACGGDPGKHVYGNTPRAAAVVGVENAVRAAERTAYERSAKLVRRAHGVLAKDIKAAGASRRVIGSKEVLELVTELATAVDSLKP